MEVTTVVCDLCGKPSVRQITIDVCQKHNEQASQRGHGQPSAMLGRYHASARQPCPFCGNGPFFPQGMAAHMRSTHPLKMARWAADKRVAKETLKNASKTRNALPEPVKCRWCSRLVSPMGMFQHVQGAHPEHLEEWKEGRQAKK